MSDNIKTKVKIGKILDMLSKDFPQYKKDIIILRSELSLIDEISINDNIISFITNYNITLNNSLEIEEQLKYIQRGKYQKYMNDIHNLSSEKKNNYFNLIRNIVDSIIE